jgi:BirA family biotin operon repressor/biotin-[acetyl-CoA-carboxylase] ligase
MTQIKITTIDRLNSTNSYLKESLATAEPWHCVRAVSQEFGRGRFDRKWISIPKKDLTFSIVLPTVNLDSELIPNLTQITAISISKVIEDLGMKTEMKWPNDILIENKKVCGILLESIAVGGEISVIAGVGLNVNSDERIVDSRLVTTLKSKLGEEINLESLLDKITKTLYNSVSRLSKSGFNEFQTYLNSHLAYKSERKVVKIGEQTFFGIIKGVSKSGALLFLKDGDDEVSELISAEISFRNLP